MKVMTFSEVVKTKEFQIVYNGFKELFSDPRSRAVGVDNPIPLALNFLARKGLLSERLLTTLVTHPPGLLGNEQGPTHALLEREYRGHNAMLCIIAHYAMLIAYKESKKE